MEVNQISFEPLVNFIIALYQYAVEFVVTNFVRNTEYPDNQPIFEQGIRPEVKARIDRDHENYVQRIQQMHGEDMQKIYLKQEETNAAIKAEEERNRKLQAELEKYEKSFSSKH